MVLEHLSDTFETIFKPFFNFFEKMTFQKITLSHSKWTFWHFRTLGHLKMALAPFNILSQRPLNGTIQLRTKFYTLLMKKILGCMQNLRVAHSGKERLRRSFPQGPR